MLTLQRVTLCLNLDSSTGTVTLLPAKNVWNVILRDDTFTNLPIYKE